MERRKTKGGAVRPDINSFQRKRCRARRAEGKGGDWSGSWDRSLPAPGRLLGEEEAQPGQGGLLLAATRWSARRRQRQLGPCTGHQRARLPTVGVVRGPGRTCWGQSGLRRGFPLPCSRSHPCSSRQLTAGPLSSLFSERAPLPPPSPQASGWLPLPCSHLPKKARATCLNFAPKVAGCLRQGAAF